MKITIERIAALLIIAAGLFLLFFVIPRETETVEYGWIAPRTAPTVAAAILIGAAAVQLFSNSGDAARWRPVIVLRAAAFFAMVAAAVLAMPHLGFRVVAPVLALAIMLTVRERRRRWLLFGAAALPAVIWWVVVELLGRRLP